MHADLRICLFCCALFLLIPVCRQKHCSIRADNPRHRTTQMYRSELGKYFKDNIKVKQACVGVKMACF